MYKIANRELKIAALGGGAFGRRGADLCGLLEDLADKLLLVLIVAPNLFHQAREAN